MFDASYGHARIRTASGILGLSVLLTLGFAAIEWLAASYAGSLALMADAGHMLTDASALLLALVAQQLARKQPTARSSYGFGRIEVLAAAVNAIAMLGLAFYILSESLSRLFKPQPVASDHVMVVAVIGLVVNLLVAWLLSRDQTSLNTRAALAHVMGDLLGSVAALLSGLIIGLTGFYAVDPILSILVCVLILRASAVLLRDSYRILMEQVPDSVNFEQVAQELQVDPNVSEVHNLHIWETAPGHVTLTAHLQVRSLEQWPDTLRSIQKMLRDQFGIDHATL
ncbi:MAG: cation transporter, partial [Betaproteobacteria bacterium]|nr:cation transporter [Betaproteobacteria bacterium]